MDVTGTFADWLGPHRDEGVVVVICGRNVPPGRIHRCLDSLAAQRGTAWGAVVVDDASDDGAPEVLSRALRALGPARHVTCGAGAALGFIANTVLAVREVCTNPDSAIVLLDLDDALGASDALATVASVHASGADVTVGSMVRTDKEVTYTVDFSDPRGGRGGNVWQHLRSFRKALFDRLEISDLKLDRSWIDLATDWAMMVPIVEMAARPEWIRRPLYLHEPRRPRSREARARARGDHRPRPGPSLVPDGTARSSLPAGRGSSCSATTGSRTRMPAPAPCTGGGEMAISRRAFEAQMRSVARRFPSR